MLVIGHHFVIFFFLMGISVKCSKRSEVKNCDVIFILSVLTQAEAEESFAAFVPLYSLFKQHFIKTNIL